jgi:hypothetical protein
MFGNLHPFPLTSVLGCLIPFFLLSLFIAFRVKSFRAGLSIFLLFTGYAALIIILVYLITSLSEVVLQGLNLIVSIVSLAFICISGITYWLNSKNGGKIYINAQPHQGKLIPDYVYGILFLGVAFLGVGISGGKKFPDITFICMLAAGLVFGKIFLSFQFREKGIVYKGRLIRFDDIRSMEWEHLLRKDKVKIVKHSGKTMTLKVPWELLTPVDNHIQSHFPRE